MVTRHSMQTPIPQSAPRGWFETDVLNAVCPAVRIAAATVTPGFTRMASPFTVKRTLAAASRMRRKVPFHKVRLAGYGGRTVENLIDQQFGGTERRRDTQPFMARGDVYTAESGCAPNQRQLVGGGSAEAGPDADARHLRQFRHVFDSAPEHAAEDWVVHRWILEAVLARGADEQLTGEPRLHIESDRIGSEAVSAFQVSQFNQLMANKTRIAVGDEQVPFARLDVETGNQGPGGGSSGVYDQTCAQRRPIGQGDHAFSDRSHLLPGADPCPAFLSFL